MGVTIYDTGLAVGSYENNSCKSAAKLASSADDKPQVAVRAKPAVAPAVIKPQPTKVSIGAEIALAVLGLGIMGCSNVDKKCVPVEERKENCQSPNIPLNYVAEKDPARISYISEQISGALAQVPACWLNGIPSIQLVLKLEDKGREVTGLASHNYQTAHTVIALSTYVFKNEPQPLTPDEGAGRLLHEVGHHVQLSSCDDRGFAAISWSAGRAEGPVDIRPAGFLSTYAAMTNREDFSESFGYYIYHPGQFRYLAARDPVLKAKYELLRTEFFQGKEYHQTWDKLDIANEHFGSGELAEALQSFDEFSKEQSGKPGAAEALPGIFEKQLWGFYLNPYGPPIMNVKEKSEDLNSLISAYSATYPDLMPTLQKAIGMLSALPAN